MKKIEITCVKKKNNEIQELKFIVSTDPLLNPSVRKSTFIRYCKDNNLEKSIFIGKDTPVHIVDNRYLTTDPNKTKGDNLGNLDTCK